MKTRYLLSALGLASASCFAQTTALTEAQMMQYTSKASMAIIGQRAELNLVIQPQAMATMTTSNVSQTLTQTVTHPNASYIKLHFKNINLAGGGKLVVRSKDGSERYEYTEHNMRAATLAQADDGVTSFSAMSISAETAVVEYTPGSQVTTNQSAIIDYYDHGTENEPQLAPATDVGISSTCGAMERKDVQCWANTHPTEFERSRPVARLLMNGSGLCTGWRVGPDNRMFTNNHCVESASKLSNTEVWFNYQHTSCNGSTREAVVKVTGKDFLSTDYTLDYTLFTINDFAKAQPFGYFGLDVRDATQGERIYIPQHGSGNPKELSIESDRDTNGLCSVNNANANGRGTGTDLGYYCDTIGGSSGSPVLAAATNKVIALHHLGGCHNKGAKVSLIWPKVANHFNNQIPDGDNNSDPIPVAQFTADCTALSCNFDGSASSSPNGTISQYEWSYGDASSNGFGANVTHDYVSYGQYTVSLTVTDATGASATTSKQIQLVDPNDDPAKLINGVAKEGLSGAKSDTVFYYLDLPAGASNVQVSISGGSGDADLYVRKDSKPTTSTYDCRPYRWGNSESCSLTGGAGKYWVMIRGYSAYANLKLVATYTE
ncbi:trypsin-like peptidase domain-containing protein [Pseudoalteromonas luteoviolacea]|uniref:PKD domain-containing protein n=1 Tax=Pseudoalteromonas luteoviolacea TaxID=43657 RepID=UPI001B39E907|nr:PKD domain-containing protein [Pseudoalteromonas luteoviolacea]MBQ4879285.1 trypsin-like peptidase domain-containing protein [Pseudoalteromonas luteoviolacea]MBQ4908345.1 trypsin-like peptidase domain-containing protein [Pseudoalteromonas luteoviolacea]